jgi:hypothetical protein
MIALLIALQAFQVAFLWLHDWAPLPPLNDVRAVRATDSARRLVFVTMLQSAPYTAGLVFTLLGDGHLGRATATWLWVSYGVLLAGELQAWWIPYLLRPDAARAARYKTMFGATHAFLPERNGIRPNTLHVALHAATVATLATLAALTL